VDVIRYLLEFLYALDYSNDKTANKSIEEANQATDSNNPGENQLLFYANVYAAADLYLIPMLKKVAAEKFDAKITLVWDTDKFLQAVEYVYTNTAFSRDLGLRTPVLQVILENGAYYFIASPDSSLLSLRKLIYECPELGNNIVMLSLPNALNGIELKGFKVMQCRASNCNFIWEAAPRPRGAIECPRCNSRSARV
jgi:hypothetical protein